jgi:hypothetical protein
MSISNQSIARARSSNVTQLPLHMPVACQGFASDKFTLIKDKVVLKFFRGLKGSFLAMTYLTYYYKRLINSNVLQNELADKIL